MRRHRYTTMVIRNYGLRSLEVANGDEQLCLKYRYFHVQIVCRGGYNYILSLTRTTHCEQIQTNLIKIGL